MSHLPIINVFDSGWWRVRSTGAAGFIPAFLNLSDPRPAKEQIATAYCMGWTETPPFILDCDPNDEYLITLTFRERILGTFTSTAVTDFRGELVIIFECDFVVVLGDNPSGNCARLT